MNIPDGYEVVILVRRIGGKPVSSIYLADLVNLDDSMQGMVLGSICADQANGKDGAEGRTSSD
jgi:hypothetical protein